MASHELAAACRLPVGVAAPPRRRAAARPTTNTHPHRMLPRRLVVALAAIARASDALSVDPFAWRDRDLSPQRETRTIDQIIKLGCRWGRRRNLNPPTQTT